MKVSFLLTSWIRYQRTQKPPENWKSSDFVLGLWGLVSFSTTIKGSRETLLTLASYNTVRAEGSRSDTTVLHKSMRILLPPADPPLGAVPTSTEINMTP